MSRPTCAAKTCYNSYTNRPMMKFFPFPNDNERARIWIMNCGREELLNEPLSKLSKYYLCASHFEDNCFLNPKFKTKFKKNLKPIPTIFYNNLSEFLSKTMQQKVKNMINTVTMEEAILGSGEGDKNIFQRDLNVYYFNTEENQNYGISNDLNDENPCDISNINEGNMFIQCRLCGSCIEPHIVNEYKDIFIEENLMLREIIDYVCINKVEDDELPRHVCNTCEVKVNECYHVIASFEKVYKSFKKLANPSQQTEDVPDSLNNFGTKSVDNCEPQFNSSVDNTISCIDENPASGDFKYNVNFYNSEKMELNINIDSKGFQCENENGIINCDFQGDKSVQFNENDFENTMLKCQHCCAAFNSKGSLKLHEKHVHANAFTKCVKCNKVMSPGNFTKHMASHMPKENQCEYCGIQYRTKKRLESHLKTHTNKHETFCSFCGKEFKSQSQKQTHEKGHFQNPNLLCELCGRTYLDQRGLDNHMKTHQKWQPTTCLVCSKAFTTELDLETHKTENPTDFKCPVCSKLFHLKARLKQHMLSHSDERPFICNCGTAFNRKGNLSQHIKKFHQQVVEDGTTENSLHRCRLCCRLVKSSESLKWHLAKHAGDTSPYDCNYCDKRFGNIVKYKNHLRSHTGERPFPCSYCSKTFGSKDVLRQHELIHQNVYSYRCNQCDRVFKRQHSLIIHKRTHSGDRPFICLICNKRFLQKVDLNKHIESHNRQIKNAQIQKNFIPFQSTLKKALREQSNLEELAPFTKMPMNPLQFYNDEDIASFTGTELPLLNVPIEFNPEIPMNSNVA